jgi:hypothetical protein
LLAHSFPFILFLSFLLSSCYFDFQLHTVTHCDNTTLPSDIISSSTMATAAAVGHLAAAPPSFVPANVAEFGSLGDRSHTVLITSAVFLAIATVFVVMRCVSKFGIRKRADVDDGVIILAWVSKLPGRAALAQPPTSRPTCLVLVHAACKTS